MSMTRILVFTNVAFFIFSMIATSVFIFPFNELLGLMKSDFYQGAFWQPLSSMFIHGGIIHLAVNMMALLSIGAPIEREMGSSRFAWLYFLSGLGGGAAVLLLPGDPYVRTVGASGAILGILGALAVTFPQSRLMLFFIPMKARTAAIGFGVLSFFLAIRYPGIGGISHAGHLGGLIAGMLFTKFFFLNRKRRESNRKVEGDNSRNYANDSFAQREILERLRQEMLRQPGDSTGSAGFSSERDITASAREVKNGIQNDISHEKATGDTAKEKMHDPDSPRLQYDPKKGEFYFR